MLKRRAYQKLVEWKTRKGRKPLIIKGARQVGKSTLVQMFSKEFDHFVSLNLELSEDIAIFNDMDDPSKLIETLLFSQQIPSKHGTVLFFIDEIQESPKAIQYLRYFYEMFPDIHVIVAGSLLEFALGEIKSFPVGRVEQMALHPLNFEEFLMAKGNKPAIEAMNHFPVQDHQHKTMLSFFHEYALIGGMPEVVDTYIKEGSAVGLSRIYDSLWDGYKSDAEKYGKNASIKQVIRSVINAAPSEKDRISFEGFGKSNYKSREVGEALRSLDQARIIQLIYPTTNVSPPISTDLKRKPRLQFLDTGLLNYALGVQADMIGIKDLNDFHRGKIIQHLATQELQSRMDRSSYKPHFWVREKAKSSAEVDLVYLHNQMIIPIEVKSGPTGKLRSLHQFMDRCEHNIAIRLSANFFAVNHAKTPSDKKFKLIDIPYYLASKIPEYLRLESDEK